MMNEEFEKLLIENREYKSKVSPLFIIICFAIAALLIYVGKEMSSSYSLYPIALGIGFIIGVIIRINRTRKEAVPDSFWIDLIQNNPDDIVWIKPIIDKTSVAGITLLKTRDFIFYTKDKYRLTLYCVSDNDLEIFWKGIKTYLPNTHIGYSVEIKNLYEDNAETFIKSLKSNGLYMPVSSLNL
ncbi:MAG: hypothetical protein LBV71_05135 [Prevotella sp.]|jgi:hypothetical protein|nr:hypothetical protein [Prevotella sp.]